MSEQNKPVEDQSKAQDEKVEEKKAEEKPEEKKAEEKPEEKKAEEKSEEKKAEEKPAGETKPGEEKKETKAAAKERAKAEKKAAQAAEEQARLREKAEAIKKFAAVFGKANLVQSTTHNTRKYVEVSALDEELAGQTVIVRARVLTVRKKGKVAFLVLRGNGDTVQGLCSVSDAVPKEMVDFIGSLSSESIVDVEAVVNKPPSPIVSTTRQNVELGVQKIHTISEAAGLPFLFEDASRPDEAEGIKVGFDNRLNCRWLDVRTPASNSIFKLESRVGQYFREYLINNDFYEIHSPKMIGAASEGGANVFKLGYFGGNAYLAQSPQLYKQMAVQSDLTRVFEVAPVFRAENSNTHRHLTEFVGLDLEMAINEHYYEVLDVAEEMFHYIFTHLANHTKELEAVRAQHPFEPLAFQLTPEKIKEVGVGIIDSKVDATDPYQAYVKDDSIRMLRIPYAGAIGLLNTVMEEGSKMSPLDDINTTNEKKLGELIKARYGTDFFISDRFPSSVRPFYTMPCPDDDQLTNSFDMFIRGEEISSGAQRIHDAEMLLARAKSLSVDLTPLKDYVDSFRLGAWPHGGFGIGLERVVMLYLGLHNIRYASMYPRDPSRVTP